MSDPVVDGRNRRRGRNMELVVEAMLELLAAGELWPSAAAVAARAGLSERSLFRYYDDLDTLAQAAVARQVARADHMFQPLPADGSRDERIDRLVAHRLAMFELVGPIVLAARARVGMYEAVAQGLALRRRQLRAQLRDLFAPELGDDGNDDLLVALEVTTGLEALQSLRVDRSCSPARTRRILHRSVAALLAP